MYIYILDDNHPTYVYLYIHLISFQAAQEKESCKKSRRIICQILLKIYIQKFSINYRLTIVLYCGNAVCFFSQKNVLNCIEMDC